MIGYSRKHYEWRNWPRSTVEPCTFAAQQWLAKRNSRFGSSSRRASHAAVSLLAGRIGNERRSEAGDNHEEHKKGEKWCLVSSHQINGNCMDSLLFSTLVPPICTGDRSRACKTRTRLCIFVIVSAAQTDRPHLDGALLALFRKHGALINSISSHSNLLSSSNLTHCASSACGQYIHEETPSPHKTLFPHQNQHPYRFLSPPPKTHFPASSCPLSIWNMRQARLLATPPLQEMSADLLSRYHRLGSPDFVSSNSSAPRPPNSTQSLSHQK